ncbi:MAG: sugar nucleotide-binding protein, partial [Pseudomonadota bacterium]
YVFSGDEDRWYIESDIPDSDNPVGMTKSSAEFFIQRTALDYLIFRCCPLYGRSYNPKQLTDFERLQKAYLNHQMFVADNHIFNGFLDVTYLAMLMKICFDRDVSSRLYQVSSSDYLTYYDFAQIYAQVFHENPNMISKGKWPFPNEQGLDNLFFKLDTNNLEGHLNLKLPTIKESLELCYGRLHGQAKQAKEKGQGISFI